MNETICHCFGYSKGEIIRDALINPKASVIPQKY